MCCATFIFFSFLFFSFAKITQAILGSHEDLVVVSYAILVSSICKDDSISLDVIKDSSRDYTTMSMAVDISCFRLLASPLHSDLKSGNWQKWYSCFG